ncbi:phosphatase PAP2 family protein [Salinirubellus salinus]|uniref:Phosphatase PAP2 family protein n=1 Tax=Salinirubellus salinus TaxID=1364945 RepID=A0A9E7QZD9_9EURY|nr:phosphatase PAP2 family protein [Salinirubellus salinus]UWM52850.1 phosphatase PAP2 family protein [Salinirubellus salinus]
MSHGLGVTEFLTANTPDVFVVLFAVLTQLGGLWFYFLALTAAYTLGEGLLPRAFLDRERVAYLVALALGAAALTATLKGLVAHPRPPTATVAAGADLVPEALRPLYERAATEDGFALPSGHATGATVIYGGVATVLAAGTRRQRYLRAGLVVAVVALSRLVLGVHYLGDVLAGVAVGAGYLLLVDRVAGRGARPELAFSVAGVVAALAVLVEGFGAESTAVLGAALGARLVWGAVGGDVRALDTTRTVGVLALAFSLPVFGGLFGATYALEPAAPLALLGGAVSVGGILVAPLIGSRLAGR